MNTEARAICPLPKPPSTTAACTVAHDPATAVYESACCVHPVNHILNLLVWLQTFGVRILRSLRLSCVIRHGTTMPVSRFAGMLGGAARQAMEAAATAVDAAL